jgi:membrane fusion protein, multidrug efflux system
MKKTLTLLTLSILLFSCGNGNEKSTESLIKSKDYKALQDKKAALQAEIISIDQALATQENQVAEALVAVQVVKDTLFTHYLEVQGSVDTKENILVQPEIPGTLVTLNVKAGQRVSKGQILGRVDDGGSSQQVQSLQTQYNLAKTTFERQKNLWEQKIGSEIQYLQAQTQMVSLQKSVAQAQAQLSKTIIRAPFSGTIDEVYAERGQVVAASPQGLMRIVNLNNMYVSTSVPETYIGKLKAGTEVDVYLASLGKTYKGKVRQVGSFINPSNRSFGIEVSLPNPDNLLRPNQVAQLKIIDYVAKNATVVPTNVIQKDADNKNYVFVAENATQKSGMAKKVFVETGKTSNNFTEIVSGLSSGNVIVTDGINTISEGMKLNF